MLTEEKFEERTTRKDVSEKDVGGKGEAEIETGGATV